MHHDGFGFDFVKYMNKLYIYIHIYMYNMDGFYMMIIAMNTVCALLIIAGFIFLVQTDTEVNEKASSTVSPITPTRQPMETAAPSHKTCQPRGTCRSTLKNCPPNERRIPTGRWYYKKQTGGNTFACEEEFDDCNRKICTPEGTSFSSKHQCETHCEQQ
jgi:hypothetical protein